MPDVQLKLNASGISQILKSSAVLADLRSRAARIAASAGPGMEVDARVGSRRARASVRTATHEARVAEATNRRLTRAFDSGR